jgi:hypothetical protein
MSLDRVAWDKKQGTAQEMQHALFGRYRSHGPQTGWKLPVSPKITSSGCDHLHIEDLNQFGRDNSVSLPVELTTPWSRVVDRILLSPQAEPHETLYRHLPASSTPSHPYLSFAVKEGDCARPWHDMT